jgi:hypothetical protein
MTTPFVQPYRQFPVDDARSLERQLVNQGTQYGTAINQRTVGVFELYTPPEAAPSNAPAPSLPNGERWFPAAAQQRLRDGKRLVVQVSDAVLTVDHNIRLINQVTRLYGAFFDGIFWQALPYVDVLAATNQINIKVSNSTQPPAPFVSGQIIVTKGGGAPSISLGIVVLEYL